MKPRLSNRQKRTNAYGSDWNAISRECVKLHSGKCAKCGLAAATAHHIIPLSRGGRNIQSNLQCLCSNCHSLKHKHLLNRSQK